MVAILQVAVGLIFIFSLLSILVTTINTFVVNLLKTRTRFLKLGVNSLLTDPELQAAFLSHPLVKLARVKEMVMPGTLTSQADVAQAAAAVNQADLTRLTHIEPAMFAQVLTSLLIEKSELIVYGPLLVLADGLPDDLPKARITDLAFGVQATGEGLNELRAVIITLPAEHQPNLLAALEPIAEAIAEAREQGADGLLLPLLNGIRRVSDDAFRRSMKVLVSQARTMADVQAQLESWFDARMNQVSDLFQRQLAFYSLVAGITLVLVLNVDSLNIGVTLWQDPTRREAVSAAAEKAIADGTVTLDGVTNAQTADAAPGAVPATLDQTLNALLTLDVPIGWGFVAVEGGCFLGEGAMPPPACDSPANLWAHIPGNSPFWGGLILKKVIGLVISVIAIAQGAPFWFDLLNRLVRRS